MNEEIKLPKYVDYYGMTKEEVKSLETMLYPDAIKFKKQKAYELHARLNNTPLLERPFGRINRVGNAIEFNQNFLDELYER